MARVLVADDEVKLGRLLQEALSADGHQVVHVTAAKEALAQLGKGAFDIVVTDLRMPDADGLSVLRAARRRTPAPEVILMTAYGSTEVAVEAMKEGAADYLTKPFSLDELRIRVRRLWSQRNAEEKSARLVQRLLPTLVAQSPRMRPVLESADQVARTDATVLLLGESGTGKSQLARYIHYSSPRADGPFVEIHCAALPESLLESELFGHEKGAFTGAQERKGGLLAGADGGTLFLDEVGEISSATQVKLLRFLQNREFLPVGSTQARKVNVRVVAATNRDLTEAVRQGAFREDFYYRLNVFSIVLPPLRERPEDILPLAEAFLAGRGLPSSKLSPHARERLLAHRWPGNIRELENALERALIIAGDAPIQPDQLGPGGAPSSKHLGAAELLRDGFNLDAFERDLIYAALDRAGGNKAAAARLLGITRRRLYSRMQSLDERLKDPGDD
jgi:two-component system, NtrC family, response regulator HydG